MNSLPPARCSTLLPPPLAPKVEPVAIASLQPFKTNARKHGETQIRKLMTSIERFGFVNPVLIDASGTIVAGHGRVTAARRLGLGAVPAIRLDHLSAADLRAYRIADNRLAELAEWDSQTLAIEWQELQALVPDLDLTITGFDLPEIEAQIDTAIRRRNAPDRADALPPEDDRASPVSKLGDLWELGPHLLLCGDARDPAAYQTLLGTEQADVVFTDPPYNVAIDGHVGGGGSVKHREFVMAAGEMSPTEFTAFLGATLGNLARYSRPGSIHFVAMDWRHLPELLQAGTAVYSEFKNLCVWVKDNGGMGSLYRSQHELVLVFKNGAGEHRNNVQLGRFGRYRTNVWSYAGVNSLRAGRMDELRLHPTVKPVALVADALLDCSKRGDLVLDAFAGSGTIFIAAEQTGRRARALELDPGYVDVAVRRWQNWTGAAARLVGSGATFDAIALERAEAAPSPGPVQGGR
ncbi:MAG: ParB N-terminal domain-containing protein [Rhodospirillales bacterium]|nr:ParB N-terminal domain-containing protein [Rhodospirillales bacterium]